MEILFIVSEVAPYSSAPGAAAVCGALPKALRGLGHHLTVLTPLHPSIDPNAQSLARRLSTLAVEIAGETHVCELYDGRTTGGVDQIFIGNKALFGIDAEQPPSKLAWLVFCEAAIEVAANLEAGVDVIHAHDWQTAAILVAAKSRLESAGRVLTVHTPQDQGALNGTPAPAGLKDAVDASKGGLLGAGIASAGYVTVDGPTLASSLTDDGDGFGLEALLTAKGSQLVGISNGLDASVWNPLTDIHLQSRFDPADLAGKAACKGAVQFELELPARPEVPLVGVVLSTMSDEGRALVAELVAPLLRNDVQLALLDVADREDPALDALCLKHPDSIARWDDDSPPNMHKLLAGCDLLLLPEAQPGGLHLCAQRYGTLPVALASGPVTDNVVDCDAQLKTGNGFLFTEATEVSLRAATQRGLSAYTKGDEFDRLRSSVMQQDSSWERSARRYDHIYGTLKS